MLAEEAPLRCNAIALQHGRGPSSPWEEKVGGGQWEPKVPLIFAPSSCRSGQGATNNARVPGATVLAQEPINA